MNGTPRLRSSYPPTPGSGGRTAESPWTPSTAVKTKPALPNLPSSSSKNPHSVGPVIPVTLIDAPSQRMYALTIYSLLLLWRFYNWFKLVENETTSILLFIQWNSIDLLFFFGVPQLRIPWLEWSSGTSTLFYLLHALINGILMFRIPLPIEGWLLLLLKTLFDKELSISENSVRPANIIHNASLIMGKKIINVLPEGSAIMNPDNLSFCLDSQHPSVTIPLHFNKTIPSDVQLIRFDLDTNTNETISLSSRERKHRFIDVEKSVATLSYVAKKPGIYRLHKVVDQSSLEIRRRMSDTMIVRCPMVTVRAATVDRCIGDLSDLNMDITGTPPLTIVYSRSVNDEKSFHRFQSIQPENFASPLLGSAGTTALMAGNEDFSWAQARRITVPLNESMSPSGQWLYTIDEIHDAAGNVADFTSKDEDGEHSYPRGSQLGQTLTVHERPQARMNGCDSRTPLMVASGKAVHLPAEFRTSSRTSDDDSYTLTWKYSPLGSLTASGDHGDQAIIEEFISKPSSQMTPKIREPGLYTLLGVKSKFCEGEVKEPATCLLLNPPEPGLTLTAQNITDKCAGKPIGLLVDLDLIGTPPFVLRYEVITDDAIYTESIKIPSLRYQLELKPREAGHFKYRFTSLDDEVYQGFKLDREALVLDQDVRPPASARLRRVSKPIDACIEEPVEIVVDFSGESPYILEYELVHNGKRNREKVSGIEAEAFQIQTKPLVNGGEYSLALTSIQDATGCKIFLNDELKFRVRHQRPKASFGHIEGKHRTLEIEGSQIALPVRLTGQGPWDIKYRNLNDTAGRIFAIKAQSTNDVIIVSQSGIYEIFDFADNQCPGTIDPLASTFIVDWLARPQIRLADTTTLIEDGSKHLKREVCEGDLDSVEINLLGSPPYHVVYQIHYSPVSGPSSISNKGFDAALGLATVVMDTAKPGKYAYRFSELSDGLYEHDSKKFIPLIIEQRVNRKPAAKFLKPGQSYKYCNDESAGYEAIPIKLEGVPPFSLEVDIKHQSNSRPQTIKIANIESNHYEFRIPQNVLSLGSHQVSVRKVRDSNGCQQKTEFGGPHVQVQVYDIPTIYPLDSRIDYCVGERIAYTLSGTAPFEIYYTFDEVERKAKSTSTSFRRIAEKPGNFTINAVSDKASECKASTRITKVIHEMPSVRISRGGLEQVDIHEGGEAPISFEFWGTPPFEFTYTRSTNARKGHKSQVLETRHETSYEHKKTIHSSQEGTYEVVAIKDKFCAFSTQRVEAKSG